MDKDTAFCRDLVIRHDYDRYILSVAAPVKLRPALWALFAFNHEIAKTREVTRELHAGLIRLAWWSEALQKKSDATEVLRALGQAKFDLEVLEALIDARRLDLEFTAPASLDGLSGFAAACNLPLLVLAADLTNDTTDDGSLQALASAYGLCGIIRAVPAMAAQGRCILPAPMIYDLGLMPEQAHHLKPSDTLSAKILIIVGAIQNLLNNMQCRGPVTNKARQLVAFYTSRIIKAGGNPFDTRVCGPVPFLGFRLLFQDQ